MGTSPFSQGFIALMTLTSCTYPLWPTYGCYWQGRICAPLTQICPQNICNVCQRPNGALSVIRLDRNAESARIPAKSQNLRYNFCVFLWQKFEKLTRNLAPDRVHTTIPTITRITTTIITTATDITVFLEAILNSTKLQHRKNFPIKKFERKICFIWRKTPATP